MKGFKTLPLLVLLATVLGTPLAEAQIGNRIKKKVGERVQRAQDRAEDKALDAIEGAVNCVVDDQACINEANASGKPVVLTDQAGQPLPAERQPAGSQPPGTGAWVNYDFVPGTRPLFVDDFSRDNVGDFPRRLEFIDGNMEVAEWHGARFLRATTRARLAIALQEALPEQFTIEFSAAIGTGEYGGGDMTVRFAEQAREEMRFHVWNKEGRGGLVGGGRTTLGKASGPLRGGELFHVRIMADGRYAKVYLNDTRVANVPNAEIGRSNKIAFQLAGTEDGPTFIGNIRVMAGGKKLYDALAESGRVATQGIFFDTGSDRLRPESTPTLKEISQMLQEHPDLKLVIEGHTDNVGDDGANLALSEKRAAAVRAYLVESAGVDESRLEAKGLGETKPAASNDTPEGRQQNRRVELVRQ